MTAERTAFILTIADAVWGNDPEMMPAEFTHHASLCGVRFDGVDYRCPTCHHDPCVCDAAFEGERR